MCAVSPSGLKRHFPGHQRVLSPFFRVYWPFFSISIFCPIFHVISSFSYWFVRVFSKMLTIYWSYAQLTLLFAFPWFLKILGVVFVRVEQEPLAVMLCSLSQYNSRLWPYSLTPQSWECSSIHLSTCVKLCCSYLGLEFTCSLFLHRAGDTQHVCSLYRSPVFSTASLTRNSLPGGRPNLAMCGPELSPVVCPSGPSLCLCTISTVSDDPGVLMILLGHNAHRKVLISSVQISTVPWARGQSIRRLRTPRSLLSTHCPFAQSTTSLTSNSADWFPLFFAPCKWDLVTRSPVSLSLLRVIFVSFTQLSLFAVDHWFYFLKLFPPIIWNNLKFMEEHLQISRTNNIFPSF